MPPADDPRDKYRRAEQRLREVLLGDATYSLGAVKGHDQRGKVSAELRRMHEAFDELTRREADLAEELLEGAKREAERKRSRSSTD